MKINSTNNNINFESRIKIIGPKKYSKKISQMSRSANYENISQWFIYPEFTLGGSSKAYRKHITQGSTENIRSCTAGLITKEKNPAPLFFHLYDCAENINFCSILDTHMMGTNGFLLGSRKQFKESPILFKAIKKMIDNNKISLTFFEDFKNNWEASIAYNSIKDEIYICIKDILDPSKHIKNLQELQNAFSKIQISPKDTIEFIPD